MTAARPRILIVEDEQPLRELIVDIDDSLEAPAPRQVVRAHVGVEVHAGKGMRASPGST